MKLIRFKTLAGTVIYVNPQQIRTIVAGYGSHKPYEEHTAIYLVDTEPGLPINVEGSLEWVANHIHESTS